MKLSKDQLLKELESPKERKHTIIFLGMSGMGKTHWSKLLAEKHSLQHVEVDELIGKSKEFFSLIKGFTGREESEKLGKYFGHPWDSEYNAKEEKYLSIEKRIMSKDFPAGTVLDLTGSAVYHEEQLKNLVRKGLAICLESSREKQDEMFRSYVSNPKPICWNGIFAKNDGESNQKALGRCYSKLLEQREKLYREYADVRIPYEAALRLENVEDFVKEVSSRLQN